MRKYTLTITLLFCFIAVQSQTADEKIKRLINQSDIFELDRQYPLLKDSMQNEMMRVVSEAWLAHYFNRPEAACALFEKLNTDYREQMGKNIAFMTMIWAEDLVRIGRAQEAATHLQNIVPLFPSETDDAKFFCTKAEAAQKDSRYPKSELIRPNRNTIIPFFMELCGDGELMKVFIKVNGKNIPFVFDTGCASVNGISQRLAQECNLRIIEDSTTATGSHTEIHGSLGIADSIEIGDIVYRNILFSINPFCETDSIFKIETLFGGRFFDDIGEFQIDNKLNQIIFPIKESPLPVTGRNLIIKNNLPYLEVLAEEERLLFLFDTGYSSSRLIEPYYKKNKDEIEKKGAEKTIFSVGVGGGKEVSVYTLSSFPLQVGSAKCKLSEIYVDTTPVQAEVVTKYGTLGLDFLRMFNKVTVNYNQMFVKVE